MSPILRAAGFAAASLLAIGGASYAAPAQNWSEFPTTSTLLDHESASLSLAGGDLGLNPVEAVPVAPAIVEPSIPAEIPAEIEPPSRSRAGGRFTRSSSGRIFLAFSARSISPAPIA